MILINLTCVMTPYEKEMLRLRQEEINLQRRQIERAEAADLAAHPSFQFNGQLFRWENGKYVGRSLNRSIWST